MGFPWNWVPALASKETSMMGFTGPRRKFDDIFSHLDKLHEMTDRRTDTEQQQIPCLRQWLK